MLAIPARVIATCFALVSFTAAIVVGLASENPAWLILLRATGVMVVCWVVGRLAGGVAQRAIDHHVDRYKAQNPIPEDGTSNAGHAAPDEGAAASA